MEKKIPKTILEYPKNQYYGELRLPNWSPTNYKYFEHPIPF